MKRIQYACLEQTIHFQLKEAPDRERAVRGAREELAQYKAQLDRRRTRYRVVSETEEPDGSVVLRIKRQYNDYACGDYLD